MHDDIQDLLKKAERTFEGSPGTIEEGLDVDDAELVQLRRACRLLEVGSNLLDQGYYTVVIESAFVAIERTIQFRLIHDGAMSAAEVISSHQRLYQRGAEIGLYDDAFGADLAELWNRNRTKTYYGKFEAKASPFRAGMKPTNSIQPPTMARTGFQRNL